MRYFGEMSNPQIAKTLGISVGATAVALHKARARLKRLLAEAELDKAMLKELAEGKW